MQSYSSKYFLLLLIFAILVLLISIVGVSFAYSFYDANNSKYFSLFDTLNFVYITCVFPNNITFCETWIPKNISVYNSTLLSHLIYLGTK